MSGAASRRQDPHTAQVSVRSISDVRKIFTPGVASICKLIQKNREEVFRYTYLKDTVAIVTNGIPILGLGDIGVRAGLPVMEGKSVQFSTLVGINGIRILVDSRDPDEIVRTVAAIAKSLGLSSSRTSRPPSAFRSRTISLAISTSR